MRPQTYPHNHTQPDADEGCIFFESAAGNPTVFGGRGLVSVTRSAAGRYPVTIVGDWAQLVFKGIGVAQSGTVDIKAHVDKSTIASSSDGRTTSFTVVLVVGTAEADSAGAVLTVPFLGWMSR